MLDVLGLWRAHGIGRHHIGAYAKVSVYDHVLMRTACWLFGGLYLGLSLPISAQDQQTWDFTGSLSGTHTPGSWGGHAVDVVRYDANTLTIVTWGALKKMTWAFADRYCDEAYCLLSNDFLKGKHAPNGFDLDAKKSDNEPSLLLDQIQEGRYEFRTIDENGELTDWSDKGDEPGLTPVMVRIVVRMQPEARVEFPEMQIPLMLDAGARRAPGQLQAAGRLGSLPPPVPAQ
jgi:hypothetical protein